MDVEPLVMIMVFCVIMPWWIANNISFTKSESKLFKKMVKYGIIKRVERR
jgi:membrane protein CcdC involved in cytochrome C biogenesis